MKEHGKTANNMGTEDTETNTEKKNLDFGEMVQEKDGLHLMNSIKLKIKVISIF